VNCFGVSGGHPVTCGAATGLPPGALIYILAVRRRPRPRRSASRYSRGDIAEANLGIPLPAG
jgi:hypothetical protein